MRETKIARRDGGRRQLQTSRLFPPEGQQRSRPKILGQSPIPEPRRLELPPARLELHAERSRQKVAGKIPKTRRLVLPQARHQTLKGTAMREHADRRDSRYQVAIRAFRVGPPS